VSALPATATRANRTYRRRRVVNKVMMGLSAVALAFGLFWLVWILAVLVWEGANALELTSHAYEGDMWDRDNKLLHFSGKYRSDVTTERVDPATALWLGMKETWFVVDRTLSYIGGIFTGREAADQIGGPLRIAQISGQVATLGLIPLIQLSAVLSISIGLLNLFPVPLLDGGHLLFYTVEAVRGRPLSERAQEMGFRIGLGLVLMLMVFATYHDILRLPGS